MLSRNYLCFAVLAMICLVVVAVEEIESQNTDTCDAPVKDTILTWKDVRKKKAKCKFGEYLACSPCEEYTFKKKPGIQKKCADCENGYGTLGKAADKCKKFCREGFFYSLTDEKCTKCPSGTYRSVRCLKTECTPCPEGRTTEKEGATSIDQCLLECDAGFQPSPDQSVCDPCPIGTYKTDKGGEECKECPSNKTTLTTGAKIKDQCVKDCDAGKEFNITTGLCDACDKNYYKANKGSLERCKPCPVNTVTSSKGQATCDAECWPGYQDDGMGGCQICPWGTYKPKSGSEDYCHMCPQEPLKVTVRQGAIKKSECVKLDPCVAPALERLRQYYYYIHTIQFDLNGAHLVSFLKETCFLEVSVLLNQIVLDYMTCEDLKSIELPDLKIGSHTYGNAEQKALFVGAAEHGGGYCKYLRCTDAHLQEVAECKSIMPDDPDQPLNICSPKWEAGAQCLMLNVKNCPPLQFHPEVIDDINLGIASPADIYQKPSLADVCGNGFMYILQ